MAPRARAAWNEGPVLEAPCLLLCGHVFESVPAICYRWRCGENLFPEQGNQAAERGDDLRVPRPGPGTGGAFNCRNGRFGNRRNELQRRADCTDFRPDL